MSPCANNIRQMTMRGSLGEENGVGIKGRGEISSAYIYLSHYLSQ